MKRFLLSVALLLACSGVAFAQESEFSGGGGGGITAAPGSGTAGTVPKFASATSLEDSIITQSGVVSVAINGSDAATNTVSDALALRHATSGTAAASFGTGLLFQGEDAGGNMQDMARISAVYETATDGAERAHLRFHNRYDGATYSTAEIRLIDPDSLAGSLRFLNSAGGGLVSEAGPMSFLSDTYIRFGERGVAYRWEIPETTGHWVPAATNTYDIGTSSALVRNIYVAGSIQGANSVSLTAATDDPFVEIAVPVGGTVGGYVEYTIVADDATDYQARSGRLPFSVVNKAGAESAVINTVYSAASEAFAESAGASTLAVTFTTDNATGSNNVRIRANAVSSLTETTLAIKCRVIVTSGTATLTFNP